MNTIALGMPGGWEWLVIGVVMLLLFGSRLPSVARSMGDALREFKKGVHEIGDEVKTPPPAERPYSSVKPPLTEGGVDQRVSHGDGAEPVPHDAGSGEKADSAGN